MSAKLPLAWSKWAAILEMAVTAKYEIEVSNSLRTQPPLVEPSEPIYEVKITGEMKTLKKKRDVRNQEKRVDWENTVIKAREKRYYVIHFVGTMQMQKYVVILFYVLVPKGNDRFNKKNYVWTYTLLPQKTS